MRDLAPPLEAGATLRVSLRLGSGRIAERIALLLAASPGIVTDAGNAPHISIVEAAAGMIEIVCSDTAPGFGPEAGRAVAPANVDGPTLQRLIHLVAAGYAIAPAHWLPATAAPVGRGDWAESEEDEAELPPLTPRETAVLALLVKGASNKLIARELGISPSTAKFHVASILRKLAAHSRLDAVATGVRRGLVMV